MLVNPACHVGRRHGTDLVAQLFSKVAVITRAGEYISKCRFRRMPGIPRPVRAIDELAPQGGILPVISKIVRELKSNMGNNGSRYIECHVSALFHQSIRDG